MEIERKKREISPENSLKEFARSLGFDPVGITTAEPLTGAEPRLNKWRQRGFAAGLNYMNRLRPRRTHPTDLMTEAKSILCLAFNYYPGSFSGNIDGPLVRVARYAVGRDYHSVLKKKLRKIERYISDTFGEDARCRSLVDSAPVLERELAWRAGLGFIGKNANLITQKYGSWVFLAEVLTSVELKPDAPCEDSCRDCSACIEACPTGALCESFTVDCNRCISWLTIENKGCLDKNIAPQMEDWVFGCDRCQEVCPHNRSAMVTLEEDFRQGRIVCTENPLEELLAVKDESAFKEKLSGSSFSRTGRRGLLRNCLIAAMNQSFERLPGRILEILADEPDEEISSLAKKLIAWQETGRLDDL